MARFAHWIHSQMLRPRVDAGFYAPVHIDREKRMSALAMPRRPLQEFSSLITDGTHQTPLYVTDGGNMFLSATNIFAGWIDPTDHKQVTAESMAYLKRSKCTPFVDDILVAKSGSIGNSAVVEKWLGEFGVFESVAIIRQSFADPHYLSTFINSKYGKGEIIRQMKGAVIRHLHLEELREFEPVLPDRRVQNYIGAKVRQADRLRTLAASQMKAAKDEYLAAITVFGYIDLPSAKIHRSAMQDRWDPNYYDPQFSGVLDSPWMKDHCEPLGRFIQGGSYGVLPDSNTYGFGDAWLLRATDLDACTVDAMAGIQVPTSEVEAKARVQDGDILLEVKGAIERCTLAIDHAVGKYVNGTVYRLSVQKIHSGYLALHLSGVIKRRYCKRVAVNNMIQYLSLDYITALPVVRLGEEIEKRLGDMYVGSKKAESQSWGLIQTAKLLVEALIEGKVTEADLLAAATDPAADRALLARLTRAGLDVPGQAPLFPDPAVLDTLVADAHGTSA